MRVFLTIVGILAAATTLTSASVDDEAVYPASKSVGHIKIDLATGERTIVADDDTNARTQDLLWDCTTSMGYYAGATDRERLDWGDIGYPAGATANHFRFAYCAQSWTPEPVTNGITVQIAFYANENGSNSPMPPSTATVVLTFSNLPGQTDPNVPSGIAGCYTIDVDLAAACAIDPGLPCTLGLGTTSDLDSDGRADFGYSYHVPFASPTFNGAPAAAGPLMEQPTPPVGAPGADINRYDRFYPPGKWQLGNAGLYYTWTATGTQPGDGDYGMFQYYLQLYGCATADTDGDGVCDNSDNCPTTFCPTGPTGCDGHGCPSTVCPAASSLAECACADNNNDGRVDLSDLAALLAHYGESGAGLPGDCTAPCGKIDLADLAYTVARYSMSGCTIP